MKYYIKACLLDLEDRWAERGGMTEWEEPARAAPTPGKQKIWVKIKWKMKKNEKCLFPNTQEFHIKFW